MFDIVRSGLLFTVAGPLWVVSLIGCGEQIVAVTDSKQVAAIEPVWDFGAVDPAKKNELQHHFAVRNNTGASVSIAAVNTSCGCLVVTEAIGEIGAGCELKIPVKVQLGGAPGPFSKTVSVIFSDEALTPLELRIQGQLLTTKQLFCVPNMVNFGSVTAGESVVKTVKLFRYDGSAVEDPRFNFSTEGLQATSVISANNSCTVELTLEGDRAPLGLMEGAIAVTFGSKSEASARIPVKFRVVRETFGLRKSVFLRDLPPAGEEARVRIFEDDQLGRKVVSVQYRGDGTDSRGECLQWILDGQTLYVSRVKGSRAIGLKRGELIVSLTDTVRPVILPVRIWLSRGDSGSVNE